MTKQKEILSKQKGNGVKRNVSGNEALRGAVAFADWIKAENYICGYTKWWQRVAHSQTYTTIELYKKFISQMAKATDR